MSHKPKVEKNNGFKPLELYEGGRKTCRMTCDKEKKKVKLSLLRSMYNI